MPQVTPQATSYRVTRNSQRFWFPQRISLIG